MIDVLRANNQKLINIYINDKEKLAKHKLIATLLKDDKCFFKMDIKTAYMILKDLQFTEKEIDKVYSELINIKNYSGNKNNVI